MRINIILALLLVIHCGIAMAQPTPPATPSNPESMGIQVPQPASGAQAPPVSESNQALVPTTQASAMSAAPSTMAAASTTGAYMTIPSGTTACNQFYIPYYPSTVASCYFGQWVPMWLDVKGNGPLYSYEWYPNGKLVSQYIANIAYPSWQKMWFYGDAPGWHTLQYYCNGWSNYIYVYVYSTTTVAIPPPTAVVGCQAQIIITSQYIYYDGFSVYVDNHYVGGDGQNGDPLDSHYTFYVTGDQQHSIYVSYHGFSYMQTKTYNCGGIYTIALPGLPMQPPTEQPPAEPVYPMHPIVLPVYPTQLPSVPIYPTQLPSVPVYPTQLPSIPVYPTQLPSTPAAPTQLPAAPAAPTQLPAETPAPTVTPY